MNNLKNFRLQRGLSQYELASISKVSRRTIQSIEQDEANPSLGTLSKLASALDIEIKELV